ncbi:helix-turn-helix domain-containing protein [Chryseobacterium sp. SC28]|uniref:helix-turn-helix domain-containing protein n=1 Tax=Chryseobacterium sp. SC28 TaxID=2268028 RepID=UPI000F654947|nr:helix-turn-helix domain-containing protein [Chryseobacterium sp. SC28]RRQ45877.1 AraC family transcriptional regulator [Chryseobacterium sp. SC28]
MDAAINFKTVKDYNDFNKNPTLHPLVSIVDLSKADPRSARKMMFDIFCVILKSVKCGDLRYGNNNYDYQEGTLVFYAPGQVVEVVGNDVYQPAGFALVFHPDFLLNTSLGKRMQEFGFFSYKTNEALHLSEKEKKLILDCFAKIQSELEQAVDKHSKKLIASNIELFLNYCERFYDRQFITREHINHGILERFEEVLNHYFTSEKPISLGLPSVAYCADELHLSPNYFGDLIKKETGKTAQDHIQNKIIEVAKQRVFDADRSISQIAYDLGFKYPQHLTRLFKQRVGVTPNEYRHLN